MNPTAENSNGIYRFTTRRPLLKRSRNVTHNIHNMHISASYNERFGISAKIIGIVGTLFFFSHRCRYYTL